LNQAIILSRSVGLNIPQTVRRIMQRMFTDTFIQQYSYVGFKGKKILLIELLQITIW